MLWKKDYKNINLIAENLEKLYTDGIGIILAFELMLELDLKKEYKESLINIKRSLEKGNSLGESFELYIELYPKFFVEIIKIGEETGQLGYVLKGLNKYYKNNYLYRSKINKSLIYPIIIIVFLILLMISSLYLIIPTFNEILINKESLPNITEKILNLSVFLEGNKILGLIYIIVIFIICPMIIILIKGNILKEKFLKIIKIYDFKNEYEILLILNLFISSGINIPKGIEFFNRNRSDELSENLNKIKNEILLGKSLEQALVKSKEISKYSLALIKIGEESGNIEDRLNIILTRLENQKEDKIKILITFIQPTLIIILAACVISFLILFLFPVMDNIYGGAI